MRSIIKAAVRIILILILLHASKYIFQSIPLTINMGGHGISQIGFWASSFSVFVVEILIVIFLWKQTDWVVNLIAKDASDDSLTIDTSNLDMIRVALFILGVYLTLTSLAEVAGYILQFGLWRAVIGPLEPASGELVSMARFATTALITLIVGLWLVFGNRGVVRRFDRVLNATILTKE